MGNSNAPLTVKNLDDYRSWPIKHRHWSFEIVEDDLHNVWINTHHLRIFYDKFPADKELKALYKSALIYAKDVKTHFVSDRAMRIELRKSKSHSSHTDILKFLDWFDRNVTQVAAKKRSNTHLDKKNELRVYHEQKISDGPIPIRLAAPQFDDPTVPLTVEEWWALEQSADGPKRVFHPEARLIPTSWKDWARDRISNGAACLLSFWRGERNLFLTFVVGILVALIPNWFLGTLLPESLDWTVSYRRVMWAFALVVPVAFICATVFCVSMTRSALQAWRLPAGKIWATAFYLLVIPLGPWIFFANYDDEMIEYWWSGVRGTYQPVTVYADPHLGRIVVRGAMEFGSAEALERELDKNPRCTLVQIESPGGKVIEGMRMAQIVIKRRMDTVAMERCASACTFVLAAGVDRYLGPGARVGFHRSGTRYGPVGDGWSDTDYQMAKYYRERGVDPSFIDKALTPSIRQIWVASHAEMFTAGYANLMWSERKTGY